MTWGQTHGTFSWLMTDMGGPSVPPLNSQCYPWVGECGVAEQVRGSKWVSSIPLSLLLQIPALTPSVTDYNYKIKPFPHDSRNWSVFYHTNKKPTTTVLKLKGLPWLTEILLGGQRDGMGGKESSRCSGFSICRVNKIRLFILLKIKCRVKQMISSLFFFF